MNLPTGLDRPSVVGRGSRSRADQRAAVIPLAPARVGLLTRDWFDAFTALGRRLPFVQGLDLRVQYDFFDAPSGCESLVEVVENGIVVHAGLGTLVGPDVSVALEYDDFRGSYAGECSIGWVFARGSVMGEPAALRRWAVYREAPHYAAMQARLREMTA